MLAFSEFLGVKMYYLHFGLWLQLRISLPSRLRFTHQLGSRLSLSYNIIIFNGSLKHGNKLSAVCASTISFYCRWITRRYRRLPFSFSIFSDDDKTRSQRTLWLRREMYIKIATDPVLILNFLSAGSVTYAFFLSADCSLSRFLVIFRRDVFPMMSNNKTEWKIGYGNVLHKNTTAFI